MSNTVAHLSVANRILKEYPTLVNNVDAFYWGSVAPDTIGSKAGYSREDKMRVHLRSGIRDPEWLIDEKMSIFKTRIQHFVGEHISNTAGHQRDFNIGYLVHLLTDEQNHRTIRQTMLGIANARNILESDKEFFYMMTNDLEAFDNYLLGSDKEVSGILSRLLRQGAKYALPGYIEKEYIEKSIQWWNNSYLVNIKQRELKYIREVDFADFVIFATQEIVNDVKSLIC